MEYLVFLVPLLFGLLGYWMITAAFRKHDNRPLFEIWYRTSDGVTHMHSHWAGEPECLDFARKLKRQEPDYPVWVINDKTGKIVWRAM